MTPFNAKTSLIRTWINGKGYSGSVENALFTYFQANSSLSQGTIFDHLNNGLGIAGYSGTLADRLTTMFQAKTGISNRKDAERAFFGNTSLDFFSGGGGTGNQVTDTDGNVITDTNGNSIFDTQ